jgi:hypothetical protein
MADRCPTFVGLFEEAIDKRNAVLDLASDPRTQRLEMYQSEEVFGSVNEAFESAHQALEDHTRSCPRCVQEGNGAG